MSKTKQFLSEAIRLVGYHNDSYNPEERIRRALVRAYKKGVKDGLGKIGGSNPLPTRHINHEN
jgi:hypothetical protein